MSQRSPTDELALPPRVEEVSEGIYAYLQPAGQWGLNNSGFLVGSRAVTLIDTCFTQRRTQAFLDAVRAAGLGDIAVGLLAPVAALSLARGGRGSHALALAWNLAGIADLVVAVTLGVLT